MVLHRVAEGSVSPDAVAVAPADALADQVLLRFELLQDALDGPLGDPDPRGDVADPGLGVLPDTEKDVGVVGQKSPGGHGSRTLQGGPAKGIRERRGAVWRWTPSSASGHAALDPATSTSTPDAAARRTGVGLEPVARSRSARRARSRSAPCCSVTGSEKAETGVRIRCPRGELDGDGQDAGGERHGRVPLVAPGPRARSSVHGRAGVVRPRPCPAARRARRHPGRPAPGRERAGSLHLNAFRR